MKLSEYWKIFNAKSLKYQEKYYCYPFLMFFKLFVHLLPSLLQIRKKERSFPFDDHYFQKEHRKKVLVVHLSDLGDYILKRNFFSLLGRSPKYQNAEFHLLLTDSSAPLAKTLDNKFFARIFTCRGSLQRLKRSGKNDVLRSIFAEGLERYYDAVLFPDFNNMVHTDAYLLLLENIRSMESIVFQGDRSYLRVYESFLSYTRVIPSIHLLNAFEFNSNKFFFEQVTGLSSPLTVPEIPTEELGPSPVSERDYIVINPGAQDNIRRWHQNNMAELVSRLPDRFKIVFCCLEKDRAYCEYAAQNAADRSRILCSLPFDEILPLLANASLYIGMDSGFFHLAAALKTKAVCISSGINYARFLNYPPSDRLRIALPYGIEEFYQSFYREQEENSLFENPRNKFNVLINSFQNLKIIDNKILKALRQSLTNSNNSVFAAQSLNIFGPVNAVSLEEVLKAVDELLT